MRPSRKKQTTRQVMGIHSCLETLKVRPKKIRAIYIQQNWSDHHELKFIVDQARRYKIEFNEQTSAQLTSFGQGHQGVALTVEESPEWALSSSGNTLVYIDGIEDPRNLGAIIRTSWLMGVSGLFLPEHHSIRSLTSTVCKTASGGVEHLPVQFLSRPSAWFKQLKSKGFWFYGLDHQAKIKLKEASFAEKRVLIVGSEGRGIKNIIKNQCDQLLYIPQKNKNASFNLSVALALSLYQVSLSDKE